MVGGVRDVITCAEFQIEIFTGYNFTGGRIFDFPIDFSMGLTTVQRYCAACDYKCGNETLWKGLKVCLAYLSYPILHMWVCFSIPGDAAYVL